jgi:hypothetical protein
MLAKMARTPGADHPIFLGPGQTVRSILKSSGMPLESADNNAPARLEGLPDVVLVSNGYEHSAADTSARMLML